MTDEWADCADEHLISHAMQGQDGALSELRGRVETKSLILTDERLISLAMKGQSWALEELIQRYQRLVFALAYRLLRSPQDAEDARQEIFFKVFRALSRFGGKQDFKAWLKEITRNHCFDVLRKRKGTENKEVDIDGDLPTPQAPPPDDNEERQIIQKILTEQKMRRLTTKERQIVELFTWQGLHHKEIAMLLDENEGTVRVTYRRALKKLQSS